MKIRTDFVTNSSSSSFIAIKIEGELIARIFAQHKQEIQEYFSEDRDFYGGNFSVDDETVTLEQGVPDGMIGEYVPTKKDEIVSSIAEMLSCGNVSKEDGLDECDESLYGFLSELFANKEEIIRTVKSVHWTGGDVNFGEYGEPNITREFVYSAAEGETYTETEEEQEDFDNFDEDDY